MHPETSAAISTVAGNHSAAAQRLTVSPLPPPTPEARLDHNNASQGISQKSKMTFILAPKRILRMKDF